MFQFAGKIVDFIKNVYYSHMLKNIIWIILNIAYCYNISNKAVYEYNIVVNQYQNIPIPNFLTKEIAIIHKKLEKKPINTLQKICNDYIKSDSWFESVHAIHDKNLIKPIITVQLNQRSIDDLWYSKSGTNPCIVSNNTVYDQCTIPEKTITQFQDTTHNLVIIRAEKKIGLPLWGEFKQLMIHKYPKFFEKIKRVVFLRRYAFKIYLDNGFVFILPMHQAMEAFEKMITVLNNDKKPNDLETIALFTKISSSISEIDFTYENKFYIKFNKRGFYKIKNILSLRK